MVKPPSMDMMTKLFLVATISVMLLAASRTGFQFFLSGFMAAYKFLSQYLSVEIIKTYSLLEAAVAVLGIEGMLVAFGIHDGYMKGDSLASMG